MNSTLSVSKGTLKVHAKGPLVSGVQLSWDSDTYGDQLSSAGLKCIDMRHEGGSAIVVEDFDLQGTCGDGIAERDCPPFVVETRIYDSVDPTGQTYSASILRWANGRVTKDLIIPFSNFNRKGLRGEGRLGCAGAVSINIRTDGYRDVTLTAGPIFTNSTEPLEALVLTPTPTTVATSPRSSATEADVSAAVPTNTPVVVSPETPSPTLSAEAILPRTTPSHGTPAASSPSESGGEVVVAPLNSPEPEQAKEEEMVYGAIVSE
jgi:hypothetical protein